MLLFHIILVTFEEVDRPFSEMKIIKIYLRKSTRQDRLEHLSLIIIENKADSKFNLSEVIDKFTHIKARKTS